MAHAASENLDEAFAWLERAFEQRSGSLVFFDRLGAGEEIGRDPRWEGMRRRIGLPE